MFHFCLVFFSQHSFHCVRYYSSEEFREYQRNTKPWKGKTKNKTNKQMLGVFLQLEVAEPTTRASLSLFFWEETSQLPRVAKIARSRSRKHWWVMQPSAVMAALPSATSCCEMLLLISFCLTGFNRRVRLAPASRLDPSFVSVGEQNYNCYLKLAACLKTRLFFLLKCKEF